MKNLWSDRVARGKGRLEQLVYRSRLIGQAPKLCVWGGGNTSTKLVARDFRGRKRNVLRIKGSGSDLKTMRADQFSRSQEVLPMAGKTTPHPMLWPNHGPILERCSARVQL